MSDLRSYSTVYPNVQKGEVEPTGGYVEVHVTHNGEEAERNIETAILLAKLGYQVRLLPIDDTPNRKNPDAYLVKEQLILEFRHNYRPTASAIDNEIRDARHQADYVLLHIQSKIKKGDLCTAIENRLNRLKAALTIKEVWLIWQGELIRLKRKEVFNGTMRRKIQ